MRCCVRIYLYEGCKEELSVGSLEGRQIEEDVCEGGKELLLHMHAVWELVTSAFFAAIFFLLQWVAMASTSSMLYSHLGPTPTQGQVTCRSHANHMMVT